MENHRESSDSPLSFGIGKWLSYKAHNPVIDGSSPSPETITNFNYSYSIFQILCKKLKDKIIMLLG